MSSIVTAASAALATGSLSSSMARIKSHAARRLFSEKYHPIGNLDEARWNKLRINTRYYNTALHRGAFALPNYVLDILKEEEHGC